MDLPFLAEALTQVSLPGQIVVLVLMLGCGGWAALRPGVLPLIGLGACAALWLRANSQLEGVVLVTITPEHGLTLADLLVPALGCATLLRRAATRAATEPEPEPRPEPAVRSVAPSGGKPRSRTAAGSPAGPAIPSPRSSPEPARPVPH